MNILEFSEHFYEKIIAEGGDHSTAKSYCVHMKMLMQFYDNKLSSPLHATKKDLEIFIINLKNNNYSASHINQFIAASKRFYRIFGQPKKCKNLLYHNRERTLPNILTFDECLQMCNADIYIKHKAIINLLYWGAMRRREIVRLKINHISKDRRITIVGSKFNKSRIITIPQHVIELLRIYYIQCNPREFLFNGDRHTNQYSADSIRNIVRDVAKLCKIEKRATPQILRSSRATHLLDNGASDMYVSEFLGHAFIQTTRDYYCRLTTKGMQNNFDRVDHILINRLKNKNE